MGWPAFASSARALAGAPALRSRMGLSCDSSCDRIVAESIGSVAQWIRHRPTEPGIAGSSPAGVIVGAAHGEYCGGRRARKSAHARTRVACVGPVADLWAVARRAARGGGARSTLRGPRTVWHRFLIGSAPLSGFPAFLTLRCGKLRSGDGPEKPPWSDSPDDSPVALVRLARRPAQTRQTTRLSPWSDSLVALVRLA